jgi:hypothetical protein
MLLTATAGSLLPARSSTAQDLPPPSPHWEYHLGQGLRLGNSGLTFGGYGSLRYEDLHARSPRLSVGALSLLLSWDTGTRVRFFSELELENFTVARGGRSFGIYNNAVELERLYADVYLSEALTFRLGKFLTPVGRWNLLHADPLVWTTSRPLVTFLPFATDTTGGMLYGSLLPMGKDLEYSVYLQVADGLDPHYLEGPFTKAAGIHLVTHLGATKLGLSYAHFKREGESPGKDNLFGLDLFWARRRLELTGEFVYRVGARGRDGDEWGLFAQGTVPLGARFFAVGRYEFFAAGEPFPGVHRWVAALAFRPLPPLVLRAEYSFAHDNTARVPEGFAASVALLF